MLMQQTIGTKIIAALGICADVQVCRGRRRQDGACNPAVSERRGAATDALFAAAGSI